VVLILLVSLAVGIPAIWLVREQLDRLAWTLVIQASHTTKALLAAHQSELDNLAILTAQRPTLSTLLETGDQSQLLPYLNILREGAGLDLVLLCAPSGGTLTPISTSRSALSEIPEHACQAATISHVYRSPPGLDPPGWLWDAESLPGQPGITVVVGDRLDEAFLEKLSDQTGVELVFTINGQPLVGTLLFDPSLWEEVEVDASMIANPPGASISTGIFILNGSLHYAAKTAYGDTGLEILVSEPTKNIAVVQSRLTWSMVGGIVVVILLSSILGYVFTKRISQPLDRLRESANALRRGNLEDPIRPDSRVREVAQVAFALEDARIALRHSLEQLRLEKAWGDHLLESVVEGIITLDRQNRVTFFSQGAERITGWKSDLALQKSIDEIFRLPEDSERFSQRLPVPGRKQEIVKVQVNGRPISLAITGARLAPTEAGNANLALVLRDVSNEEAIRRLLGDFLANITHELRTPLTAQAVSIELLLDQLDELDSGELRELLTAHHLGVLNLQTLIDNLLEGASIEAGRFRVSPQPMEIAAVISAAVKAVQPLMEKYDLQLRQTVPARLPPVMADARRTSQVLVNLLSNAIKWSPKGGRITLSASPNEVEVQVSVADQGPGISPEQKGDLFTWLPNLPTKNGRADYGAGLGLSVVRTIVEAQGGRVGVEDAPNGGAVFWFTVPVIQTQV